MSNLVDFVARLLISALFLISAYNKIFSIDGTMSWMEGFGIPGMLLYPTIVLEIILPLFIIVGYKAQLSAGLLAIFCIATAFIFHFDFNFNFPIYFGHFFVRSNRCDDRARKKILRKKWGRSPEHFCSSPPFF